MAATMVYVSGGQICISAAGVKLHLSATLETKDEILITIEPEDESDWEILAQGDENDSHGIQLILRRV